MVSNLDKQVIINQFLTENESNPTSVWQKKRSLVNNNFANTLKTYV